MTQFLVSKIKYKYPNINSIFYHTSDFFDTGKFSLHILQDVTCVSYVWRVLHTLNEGLTTPHHKKKSAFYETLKRTSDLQALVNTAMNLHVP